MSIANRLRGIVAVFLLVLAVILATHFVTMRRTVDGSQALTALAARSRLATQRAEAVAEMASAVRKYLVTRDQGYLLRLRVLDASLERGGDSAQFGGAHVPLPVSEALRASMVETHTAVALVGDSAAATEHTRNAVARTLTALEAVRLANADLARDIDAAMTNELAKVNALSRFARCLMLGLGIAALALGVVLAGFLARSITRPLHALARGTREIAAGHFGYRLSPQGHDELAAVATDFNRMAERLDELDRLKRDFVSNVSHDLKTPLSSMQETSEVLLDGLAGPVTEKQRQLIAMNIESGRRLSSMLTKLLDLSRLEANVPRTVGVIDLGQLVTRAVDHLNAGRAARGGRAVVTLTLPDNPVLVRGDAQEIAQLLDNLLENASKFSPPEGRIEVGIHGDPGDAGRLILTVADEGPGIPDADKERVFERFHQTATGRDVRARGVGLGLAICRHIVAAHRGSICVRDNAPKGSVFMISLPSLFPVDAAVERELEESLA